MVQKGFTLIELSISILVIGIIMGFGLIAVVKNSLENVKDNELKKQTFSAAEKVIQFAEDNDFILPTESEFKEIENNPNLAYFHYPIVNGVTTGNVCTDNATGVSVVQCYNTDCSDSQAIDNVTFAVISSGINNNMESLDSTGNIILRNKDPFNDDFAVIYTLSEIQGRLSCNSGNKIRIILDTIPAIIKNQSFDGVRIDVEGGIKPYRWCTSEFSRNSAESIFEHNVEPGRLYISDSNGKAIETKYMSCPSDPKKWLNQSDYIYLLNRDPANNLAVSNGTYKITVNVADGTGQTASKNFIITVTGMEK